MQEEESHAMLASDTSGPFMTDNTFSGFFKSFVLATLSEILLLRKILPAENFYNHLWRGITLKILKIDHDQVTEHVRILGAWMGLVLEGIDKQYLKGFCLAISDEFESLLETYKFRIDYKSARVQWQFVGSQDDDVSLINGAKDFLSNLNYMTTQSSELPPLPKVFVLNFWLTYHPEATPLSYLSSIPLSLFQEAPDDRPNPTHRRKFLSIRFAKMESENIFLKLSVGLPSNQLIDEDESGELGKNNLISMG